ncbi:MAG TPA: phosphoglucosamine mutase [Bacteroidales bacterium]|nr:phosphoglucosamine mutase [Bacteroidales bacterium]
MTLIKSISGIRGIIGGKPGKGLTPVDIISFTSAFAVLLATRHPNQKLNVVVGRDARTSGAMVNHLVSGTLMAMGVNVTDVGLSTTPTVEIAVAELNAHGGIILTASHNPGQWNALKLLNNLGEFISEDDGKELIALASEAKYSYAPVDKLGTVAQNNGLVELHIEKILNLPLVDVQAIRKAGFCIAIDAVNSTGGIAIPLLLKALGVEKQLLLNCEPTGHFPHNPEPLPENLTQISDAVVRSDANVGFAVDPDVDRLAIICEDGSMFGEEYTLVAVADYVLQHTPGNTVSNLSSTRALRVITENSGGSYFASAVGEVNVVEMMKKHNAVIGGEGNGGIIYPALHYGRDALAGIALFLSYLAKSGKSASQLRRQYPDFHMSKNKVILPDEVNAEMVIKEISLKYSSFPQNLLDGVRIEFGEDWVHLRLSNTEAIIRIYAESATPATAEVLAMKIIDDIKSVIPRT